MLKITVACVGKIKERYLRDGIDEFAKRLKRYCRLEILEVADTKAPETLSEAEMDEIRRQEGKRLLAKIPAQAHVAALAIEGKEFDSVSFSQWIGRKASSGVSHIVFVIGGSIGLSKEVMIRADDHLSFSRMTFPHQLMRLILLEQIYRSFRIMQNEPYHK